MNNIIKTKKGFTLVELVIVIVIVGILSVISVPIYRGYVEKAKMTEGNVLLNAIAKAELAYYVKNDCFVEDGSWYGSSVGKGRYLDIDSGGNKYFKGWETYPHNNNNVPAAQSNASVRKTALAADDEYVDYVTICTWYESPRGYVVLEMEVGSNGGYSDIRNFTEGYDAPVDDTPTACC